MCLSKNPSPNSLLCPYNPNLLLCVVSGLPSPAFEVDLSTPSILLKSLGWRRLEQRRGSLYIAHDRVYSSKSSIRDKHSCFLSPTSTSLWPCLASPNHLLPSFFSVFPSSSWNMDARLKFSFTPTVFIKQSSHQCCFFPAEELSFSC